MTDRSAEAARSAAPRRARTLQTFLSELDQRHDERGVPLFVKREFQLLNCAEPLITSYKLTLGD